MSDDRVQLEREASYIHRALFHAEPPQVVVDRYVAANRLCFPNPDARECRMVETIVARRLDVEAIELALRLRRRSRTLTGKIQILFYLVEVRADYYDFFVNRTPGLGRALPRMAGTALWTAWKYVVGSYQIWRYRFV